MGYYLNIFLRKQTWLDDLSEELCVESCVRFRHDRSFVVLAHLGQVNAILVQVFGGLVPENGEVFLLRAAQVAAVGGRLAHQLVEGAVRSATHGWMLRIPPTLTIATFLSVQASNWQ